MRFLVSDSHWDLEGYRVSLLKLESRLPRSALRILAEIGFHDASVISFAIRNEALRSRIRRQDPTSVEVELRHRSGYRYQLRYTGVVKVAVDFDGRTKTMEGADGLTVSWGIDYRGVDEWGYDEVSAVDAAYLAHEIHLHSGATILLHFRRMNIRRSRGKSG